MLISLMKKNQLIRNNLEAPLNSSTDQVPDSVSILGGVSFEQVNVVSEADIRRILAHHQRNRAALIRSLHGYSNNTKTNWIGE